MNTFIDNELDYFKFLTKTHPSFYFFINTEIVEIFLHISNLVVKYYEILENEKLVYFLKLVNNLEVNYILVNDSMTDRDKTIWNPFLNIVNKMKLTIPIYSKCY
jgi:hypothetical protein